MNKTISIISIILLSVITIAVTGFFIYLMCGNSFNWNFNFNKYSDNLIESNAYDDVYEINVDSKNSDILVEKNEDDKIVVELYTDSKNNEHKIEINNNNLFVNFNDKETLNFLRRTNKVLIKIPEKYENKLNIKSTVGDIKIGSFENLSPNINAGTGDVKAELLNELTVELTTGDVKINKLNKIECKKSVGDVKIETVKDAIVHSQTGDVKINEVTNSLDITLTTGDVKINTATINEDSSINSTTGDIKIGTYSGAYVEVNNSVGDTRVNGNDRKSDKTLTITNRIGDIKIN